VLHYGRCSPLGPYTQMFGLAQSFQSGQIHRIIVTLPPAVIAIKLDVFITNTIQTGALLSLAILLQHSLVFVG
jgi:hypothetical protein